MSLFSDFFNNTTSLNRFGLTGAQVAQLTRSRADVGGRSRSVTADPMIDAQWAGYNPSNAPNSYFDYYFSGQDIQVFIDGLEGYPEFATLPISDFGYNITQQKMPIYGFWSYTFDAMARGSRVINGTFRLITKSPDYMRRALEAAA